MMQCVMQCVMQCAMQCAMQCVMRNAGLSSLPPCLTLFVPLYYEAGAWPSARRRPSADQVLFPA
ncbi:hypothetical protein WK99_23670 [Burkholderia ubonensis]|nr:hypothetical protein WK99_23670 [Burkholderia ubonensis]